MQDIRFEVIGTMLHQIWHGNPAAAPPIHIVTASNGFLTFLGINTFWEYIPQGNGLPALVLILAFDIQTGGGPYLLYWEETEDPRNQNIIAQWIRNYPPILLQKIISMGIGNTL